jgi:hypothetical protein
MENAFSETEFSDAEAKLVIEDPKVWFCEGRISDEERERGDCKECLRARRFRPKKRRKQTFV